MLQIAFSTQPEPIAHGSTSEPAVRRFQLDFLHNLGFRTCFDNKLILGTFCNRPISEWSVDKLNEASAERMEKVELELQEQVSNS